MEGEADRRAVTVLKTDGTVMSGLDFEYTRLPPNLLVEVKRVIAR
jgi:hypothetical protein